MFAYCLNNPIKHADYNGLNAVVAYDEDAVGHIGLLVEDEEGNWWHCYWGTKGGKEGIPGRVLCFFGITVPQYSWCVEFSGNPASLEGINAANQYSGNYEIVHYFVGDFSEIIDDLQNPSGDYNLYTNNCSQFSLNMLASANTKYSGLFSNAAKHILPASANNYIHTNIENYNPGRYSNETLSLW